MKKLLLILSLFGISLPVFAEGTVYFSNRIVGAKVFCWSWATGNQGGAGAGLTAQLAVVGWGGSLTPIAPVTTFQSSSPSLSYYVNGIIVEVPGHAPGTQATLRMLVWGTSYGSYGNARASGGDSGESNDFTVTLGGNIPGVPPAVPGNLTGLQSFGVFRTACVPEPTVGVFLGLGGFLLALRRRS